MKKDLKSLKEKFGKFEISKEQVKKVKGGSNYICTDGYGNQELFYGYRSVRDLALETGYESGNCSPF